MDAWMASSDGEHLCIDAWADVKVIMWRKAICKKKIQLHLEKLSCLRKIIVS